MLDGAGRVLDEITGLPTYLILLNWGIYVKVTPVSGPFRLVATTNLPLDGLGNPFTGPELPTSRTFDANALDPDCPGPDSADPTLRSFTRKSPSRSPTSSDTLTFRATFSEDVQNVDSSDFTVHGSTARVKGVKQQSASVYDVTVSGGNLAKFNGRVGLDLSSSQDIQDGTGNALTGGEPSTDQTYLVDNTAPSVAIQNAPEGFSDLTAFTVTFEFSEKVTGFALADIAVGGGAASNFAAVDGSTYRADITPDGSGDVTIDVGANVARDGAGNGNAAAAQVVVSSIIIDKTLAAIADFMLNRAGQILNNQPNLTGFLNGSGQNGAQAGGPPLNLYVSADPRGMQFAFATSLNRMRSGTFSRSLSASAGNRGAMGDDGLSSHDGLSPEEAFHASVLGNSPEPLPLQVAEAGTAPADSGGSPQQPGTQQRFDVWTEARGTHSSAGDSDATLWIGYLGAHYFFSPNLLAGMVGQLDWADEENAAAGTSADGFGWMIGPYVAGRLPGGNVAMEVRAAWGQSDNSLSPLGTYSDDFETERWLARGEVEGSYAAGALTVRPEASVSYYEETQEGYTDSLTNRIPAQTISIGEVRFGPVLSYAMGSGGTKVEPSAGISGVWNFAVEGGNSSQGAPLGDESLRARLDAGLTVARSLGWSLAVTGYYDGLGVSDYEAYGGIVKLTIPLK